MGCGIAAVAAFALCAGSAWTQEQAPSPEDRARAAAGAVAPAGPETADVRAWVEEIHAGTAESLEPGDLEDWTGLVVADALARAGSVASETAGGAPNGTGAAAAPLPAERYAAGIAAGPPDRPNTAEVLVFMSLAVPEPSWAQWAAQAARAGAPLVLRGVLPAGLRATAAEVVRRLDGHEAGVAVDPRLFGLFGVERVPAVVAVPGGVPPCASRGCSDDAPPPFDAVAGNIGLAAALEAIAAEGDAGRETALRHLERLGRRP